MPPSRLSRCATLQPSRRQTALIGGCGCGNGRRQQVPGRAMWGHMPHCAVRAGRQRPGRLLPYAAEGRQDTVGLAGTQTFGQIRGIPMIIGIMLTHVRGKQGGRPTTEHLTNPAHESRQRNKCGEADTSCVRGYLPEGRARRAGGWCYGSWWAGPSVSSIRSATSSS